LVRCEINEMSRYWINVISKEHVLCGIKEGITQSGHGKEAPLKKMEKGDWILFYSPKVAFDESDKLQAFTAIGQLPDDETYQLEMSSTFKPFRRKVTFHPSKEISILPLIEKLEFIKDKKHWGFMFRFGLFEISEKDFQTISKKMFR
jgi:predicted RNA-binding protein